MPEHASRLRAALYDQQSEERSVADWGGDDLFTRMPKPRAVDDAPPPRYRPASEPALGDSPSLADDDRRAPESPARRARYSVASGPPAGGAGRSVAYGPPVARSGLSVVPGPPLARPGLSLVPEESPTARPGLSLVPEPPVGHAGHSVEPDAAAGVVGASDPRAGGERRIKVITGRPDGVPRPLPTVSAPGRRAPRSAADWVGPRPERIVMWAFALGLLLILIAVATAGAAMP